MRALLITVMAALVTPGAAAEPRADRFNPVCEGRALAPGETQVRPYATTLRVDLGARKWCDGGCEKVSPIHEVLDGMVTFERIDTPERFSLFWVSRTTGKFGGGASRRVDGKAVSGELRDGVCKRTAFTPFNARLF